MKPFRKNSRVTFIGDSITAANNYTARIADYYRKNLPELAVKFSCAAVSGGSAGSALLYYDADIAPTKPDYVTIMLGVNDSNRGLLDQPESEERNARLKSAFDTYKSRMNELIDRLISDGAEVILCTPAPYTEFQATEQKAFKGGHALILHYAEAVRAMAFERGLEVVDFHARLTELYMDEPIYGPDHVHPTDAGHARMAECFLAAQGLPIRPFVLGEAAEPISPELAEWKAEVAKIRLIYAAEWMVVRNFTLPLEEKLALVRDYIANEKWGTALFFKNIAENYIANKPFEAEIVAHINELMDHLYD